jgi:pimeloyl-ACP methyl ester carboxylesterase
MADAPSIESAILFEGPWTHRTVRANGIAMHIAEVGTGPLVLFLHGFPQFWWAWRKQLIDLSEAGFHAVAVDLRGIGGSDKPPRGYDAPELAHDIAALVAALGERDAMLVGNDMGGLIAWTVAAQQPRVARRLAVIGAAHPLRLRQAITTEPRTQGAASAYAWRTFQVPRRPEALLTRDSEYIRSLFDAWTGPRWRGTPSYVADVESYARALRIPAAAHAALEQFRWLVRSQARPDGRRFAASVRQPVTVPVLQLHGAVDACVLAATAQGSGRYVSAEYEWHLLDGVGHYPHNEAPDLVSGELIRWAKQG